MPYKDKAKNAAYAKAYHAANKERLNAKSKAYHAANKERLNAKSKAYRAANKEKINAHAKAYQATNKEKLKPKRAAYRAANKERLSAINKAWRKANREKVAAIKRRGATGWTDGQYRAKLSEQEGCCAICEVDACSTGRAFAADHCHDTGKPRGILCNKCNTGIGMLGDNLEGIMRAVRYLQKYETTVEIISEDTKLSQSAQCAHI